MLKYFLSLSLFIIALSCSSQKEIEKKEETRRNLYPKWLQDSTYSSEQTSGITYLGKDEDGVKVFLLADDVGKIHHLKILNDTSFFLNPISFSQNVISFLDTFPKLDFEEIQYDKKSETVFISIEGNGIEAKKFAGIYKLEFSNDAFDNRIESIEKISLQPEDSLLQFVKWNVGFEGLGVSTNYFYLGLEAVLNGEQFTDSTMLYIVERSNHKLIKSISTSNLGIQTIGGLYSTDDYVLWGVDRNQKKIFKIIFNKNFEITDIVFNNIETTIPGYPQYEYTGSIESITFDEDGYLYLVDDPWREKFIPSENIFEKLNTKTKNNFNQFVPIIYRYQIKSY